jgi:hypothetical protein
MVPIAARPARCSAPIQAVDVIFSGNQSEVSNSAGHRPGCPAIILYHLEEDRVSSAEIPRSGDDTLSGMGGSKQSRAISSQF